MSCNADTNEAQGNAEALKLFRKQNINIQFFFFNSVPVRDIVTHPVCNKFEPWERSVRCFPRAVLLDGGESLDWRAEIPAPRMFLSERKALVRGGFNVQWAKSGGDLSVRSEFTADFLRWICETTASK